MLSSTCWSPVRQVCRLLLTSVLLQGIFMQDVTHSLNPGAPEVLQSQHPHYKSMVLKNVLFHGSDSSMTLITSSLKLLLQGVVVQTTHDQQYWKKCFRKNSAQHPSTWTGKRLKSTHLEKEGHNISELFLPIPEALWSGIWGLCGQTFTSLESQNGLGWKGP